MLIIIDEIITVSTDGAFEAARELGAELGVLVGISSGAGVRC